MGRRIPLSGSRLTDAILWHKKMHDAQIFRIDTPKTPHLRFEYHPNSKIVYLIRVNASGPEAAKAISLPNVVGSAAAQEIVQIFLRGYHEGKAEAAVLAPA